MNVGEINANPAYNRAGNTPRREGGFFDMLTQAVSEREAESDVGVKTQATAGLFAGTSFIDPAVSAKGNVSAPSLEDMLRAKHPNLAYHVFDASTSDWRNRNDYPHYLLYQDNERATEKAANWKPEGKNPVYSPFEAPPEIWALGSVTPGSKAVIIHPKVQDRMEKEPEYAQEIYDRIEAWFDFDLARNEAIIPGSSIGMCQAVAIGEDGNIVNAQASNPLRNGITTSGCSQEEAMERLRKKIARQYYYIQLHSDAVLERKLAAMEENAAYYDTSARKRLFAMMNDSTFRAALGSTVAGMSVDKLFDITRSQLGGAVL